MSTKLSIQGRRTCSNADGDSADLPAGLPPPPPILTDDRHPFEVIADWTGVALLAAAKGLRALADTLMGVSR